MFTQSKISIRLSIITLFVILLSFIGLTIISVNYIAFNKILKASAQQLMEQTARLVKERIHLYLTPLSMDFIENKNAIIHDIVDPDNRKQFDRFLFESIRYHPEIFMVYYGTATGDFFGVDREKPDTIGLTHIINSTSPPIRIHFTLNDEGKVLNKKNLPDSYDPRVRPWYQKAVEARKPVWTDIYPFYVFGQSGYLVPGITAAAPIYNRKQQLEGVFAIDLTIDGIQNFLRELKVTENSLIYVTNEKRQIIAFRNPAEHEDVRGKILSPSLIKKLNLPLKNFKKNHESTHPVLSTYEHKGELYFQAQQPITGMKEGETWYITLIVPADDVLGPLKKVSFQALLIALIILVIGTIIVRFISQRISQPIIQLAQDAQEINNLNLAPQKPLNTRIKEISLLDNSLANMRSSLTSFQRYVPSSLVKKLISSGKIAKVGGENQIVTLLFSDIKSFTSLSEKTAPQKLMIYLSDYFQTMTESIISHQGTIDKYIGDAIMALWNAPTTDPNHALHACQSAVDMIKRAEIMNHRNRAKGIPEFVIRMGINTGEAVVGNVGSDDRLSFTALGDTVNLASRLESINKIYQTAIIVSESTYQLVSDRFVFRLLDRVAVKGKKESTTIYELVQDKNIDSLKQHKKEFAAAFSDYQKGNWMAALTQFKHLTPAYPGDQLGALYVKRCKQLLNSPPDTWDGIWHAQLK